MIFYFISAVIITFAIPVFGLIVEGINKDIYNILARLLGAKTAMIIVNWVTFPGVVHHEMAHALFGIVTGAKIKEMELFKPSGTSLGYVKFAFSGNIILRSIQYVFISIAPIVCGSISTVLIFYYTKSNSFSIWVLILIIYLLISIIFHMTMSTQDLKVMFKGVWFIFILVLIICVYFKVDVLALSGLNSIMGNLVQL